MIGNLKPLEIVLIIALVALLFGAKKLPEMARSLGKSARILKSEAKAMKKDDEATAAPHHPAQAAGQAVPRTLEAAPPDVTGSVAVSEPHRTVHS
ncbi:Sec-independent protein translocase subunit TatA [Streptomyces sp. GESEQ-4]|uniref:Sec-independent protein translocase subunit TatA n=1 Tax=Streptomyces sp. GESEQ-4 TaxID=2812655 RepID=UPI001B31E0CC|nr:Sec-independent protein translocase subunit TatA [Streptomyces sp. GESEQ-4]